MTDNEIWVPVPVPEFYNYEVSTHGRIRSVERKTRGRFGMVTRKSRIKKFGIRRGYYLTQLSNNRFQKSFSVHRLVAQAFIPNRENKPYVNHKDNNGLNNCVDNLEWCTQKENIQHCHENGYWTYRGGNDGSKCGMAKLTEEQAQEILNSSLSARELSKIYGVGAQNIRSMRRGKSWKHLKRKE